MENNITVELKKVGCVARNGQIKRRTKFWSENVKERGHLDHLGVDG